MIPILDAALSIVDKVFDRVWPDPQKKAEAQLAVMKLAQEGSFKQIEVDLELAKGQMEINKIEAAGEGTFKSGWRPFIGWVCGSALAYEFIFRPLLCWAVATWVNTPTLPPELPMGDLMTLLFGMLGLGAYRTYEKVQK